MDDQTTSRADPDTEREIDRLLLNPCKEAFDGYIRNRFIDAFKEPMAGLGLYFVTQEHLDLAAEELVSAARLANDMIPTDGTWAGTLFEMKVITTTLCLLGIPVKENVEELEGRAGKYVSFTIGGKTYPVEQTADK